jgi:hypothetical protein
MRTVVLIILLIGLSSAPSGQVPVRGPAGQSGLVHSGPASFWVDAPPDWVLDPDAGRSDGVIVALYREGKTWQTSEPVTYANVNLGQGAQSISVANVITADIARWHAQVADLVVTDGGSVNTSGGQIAMIRVFESASAKHYEAVAYIAGEQRRMAPGNRRSIVNGVQFHLSGFSEIGRTRLARRSRLHDKAAQHALHQPAARIMERPLVSAGR